MMPVLRGAQRPIDEPGLPSLLGVELDDVRARHVVAGLPIKPELLAPNGYLHAATLIALADTACGYGTLASVTNAGANFTTVELKANFLATAREGRLVCHARVRHAGGTSQVWDAEVSCRGRLLALFRCTQLVLTQPPTRLAAARGAGTDGTPSHGESRTKEKRRKWTARFR